MGELHFYRAIILSPSLSLSREILMNDSIDNFSSHNLTVGLTFRDYLGPQEIPLVPRANVRAKSESYRSARGAAA